ncbi:MAG TPA: ATP-binding cassette domain-containing protein [Ohtaekwangia sp.]|nr:ATP-binding cassette domain-containing protein [Ohtaekwangia sp.]
MTDRNTATGQSAGNDPQKASEAGTASSHLSIATQNLSKRFNHEWIFRDLTYDFQPANTYVVTGPNGSGKSTLLQVLWGQMPPTDGGLVYQKRRVSVPVEEVYQHIAIATPYMDLIDEFTLSEQVKFHFGLKRSRGNISIDEMIERMYLTGAKNKYLSNFSSGMRQRVKLALAFYTEADVLFLDEPGTNLDSQAMDWYWKELKALPVETCVIIASNQPSEYPADAHKIDITAFKKRVTTR